MDHFSDREYYGVNVKICYVIGVLLLLTGLNYSSSLEACVEGETCVSYTEDIGEYKPVLGFLLFTGFVLYGFVYPVWTRLGCICGYCKPSKSELLETDHIMDQQEGYVMTEDQKKAIKKEVAAVLHEMGMVEAIKKLGYTVRELKLD